MNSSFNTRLRTHWTTLQRMLNSWRAPEHSFLGMVRMFSSAIVCSCTVVSSCSQELIELLFNAFSQDPSSPCCYGFQELFIVPKVTSFPCDHSICIASSSDYSFSCWWPQQPDMSRWIHLDVKFEALLRCFLHFSFINAQNASFPLLQISTRSGKAWFEREGKNLFSGRGERKN